jgi:hypothetical protein
MTMINRMLGISIKDTRKLTAIGSSIIVVVHCCSSSRNVLRKDLQNAVTSGVKASIATYARN